jgi:hypothetical protein
MIAFIELSPSSRWTLYESFRCGEGKGYPFAASLFFASITFAGVVIRPLEWMEYARSHESWFERGSGRGKAKSTNSEPQLPEQMCERFRTLPSVLLRP